MPRPLTATSRLALAALVPLALSLLLASPGLAQVPATGKPAAVGQFFTVVEPINDDVLQKVESEALPVIERAAAQGLRPYLVFEFRPGEVRPGKSPFGASSDLQDFLSSRLAGAQQTVAYVPQSLSGFAVLAVLACDEIVLGPQASLGPISPEGQAVTPRERETVRALAQRKGRDADLLLGMLDPDADLREVRTADRQTHFVLAEHLAEFRAKNAVLSEKPAWEGGRRGILSADRARGVLVKLEAEDRAKIAEVYGFTNSSDDPTLGGPINPVLIRIEDQIDQVKESYLARRIKQAIAERANLIIFDIDSAGGLDRPAAEIADAISQLKGIKTVAYINDRALGVTSLIPLACDEIVFRKNARMGDVTRVRDGRNADPLPDSMIAALAARAQDLARKKGHPPAVARGMVDPAVVVSSARDSHTGAVALVTDEQLKAEPNRFQLQDTIKPAGQVLTLGAENAQALGMASRVVDDLEGLKLAYGLRGTTLRVDGPTWVDALVTLLNTPWMSWLLLFIGMFMLILEIKLPGVGLPAIVSALAFLLFFWGHYLGGTADQLEILLFLVGLVCLALELFVFPGFGVFGMSGVLLILVSVVMASHTFIWPTQEYEYRQMGRTLFQVTIAIVAVAGGAVVLGRYFPSLPLFNRMVLKPEPEDDGTDPSGKPPLDQDAPLFYLLGEVGRTTTALRPTGKARFGEVLVDVTTDGFYIEADRPVEVIEVRGSRVLVKRA